MSTTIAKPAGVPVFPPHADPTGDCVLARLLAREPERGAQRWPEGFEGGIAHRLDVSTSGALLVADDVEELVRLREFFAGKRLDKTYRFLAGTDVSWDSNVCDRAIAHAPRRRKGRMVVRRGEHTPHRGRWYEARTEFTRLSNRLWQARMRTGVMHQIRVHAAFVGIPLAGDPKYGGGSGPDDASDGVDFYLHHVGLVGDEVATDPIPLPEWARG